MPSASKALHHKKRWGNAYVIFDDNEFSIIHGDYLEDNGDVAAEGVLGIRWNGSGSDPGYPKLFNNAVWMVLPKWLSELIINQMEAPINDRVSKQSHKAMWLKRLGSITGNDTFLRYPANSLELEPAE